MREEIDYWTEQDLLADEEKAYQGSLEHERWCQKVKGYFEWRERLTPTEFGDLDQYVEEDFDRRQKYNITEADEEHWRLSKEQEELNLPF